MKLTKTQLRQIIKEELVKVLSENVPNPEFQLAAKKCGKTRMMLARVILGPAPTRDHQDNMIDRYKADKSIWDCFAEGELENLDAYTEESRAWAQKAIEEFEANPTIDYKTGQTQEVPPLGEYWPKPEGHFAKVRNRRTGEIETR